MKKILTLFICTAIVSGLQAAVPQIHLYRNDGRKFLRVDDPAVATHSIIDGKENITFRTRQLVETLPAEAVDIFKIVTTDIPRLVITVPDRPDLQQVCSKEDYLDATLAVDGNGTVPDAEAVSVKIRGRGNSSWTFPKKPMRLKFSKKTSLLGFSKAKNYVLLANYLDPSLMRNAVTLKIADLLGIPFSNHFQPVDVTFNGKDLGSFLLTEKVGINGASVDIDEETGMLFELSSEFDEKYKFRSAINHLPVMVKDPDLDEICQENPELGTPEKILAKWQQDFNSAEALAENGSPWDAFDIETCVNYMLLYNIVGNNELGHPKSMYIYKETSGPDKVYKFGPPWDFDFAFNIATMKDGVLTENSPRLSLWTNGLCNVFTGNARFMAKYKSRLRYFSTYLLPQLLEFFDTYAEQTAPSAMSNGVIWPAGNDYSWVYALNSFDHTHEAATLRQWIIDRVNYLMERADRDSFY